MKFLSLSVRINFMVRKVHKVGIVGAPNTGKTSIFNNFLRAKEKVGNWPGTTVEKHEKRVSIGGNEVVFVDVPGIYSLSASSLDEKIARNFILNERPELLVVVVNATNLYNSLLLLTELLELGFNVIVALNMFDVAERTGIKIETRKLNEAFGVKFIPTVGRSPRGVVDLKNEVVTTVKDLEKGGKRSVSSLAIPYPRAVNKAISEIEEVLLKKNVKLLADYRGISVRLLEDSDFVVSGVIPAEMVEEVSRVLEEVRKKVVEELQEDVETAIVRSRFNFIEGVLRETVEVSPTRSGGIKRKVDSILTSRIWGIGIFLVTMFLVFQMVFLVGGPISEVIERGFYALSEWVVVKGKELGWSEFFTSFLTNGLISGVGSVLVFLPYIAILFLCISVLENSGFLARSAVMMDRVMTIFGLHGKSFLPILVGFGCTVPGIMATRTLSSFKDRLVTILVLPLIPCSARITVFVVITAAVFKEYQGVVVFGMYVLGIVLAGLFAIVFRRIIAEDEYSLFVMELPDLRLPSLGVIVSEVWNRSLIFVKKAGTVIALAVVGVWIFGSLPVGVEYASEESVLGAIGKAIRPIFVPTGFGEHWQVVVSVLTAIVAREAFIGTLGALYGVSEEGITEVISGIFSIPSALSLLVFMQVAILCIPTILVIGSEVGRRWAIFAFVYTLSLAWVLSTITYNLVALVL